MTKKPTRPTGGPVKADVPYGGGREGEEKFEPAQAPFELRRRDTCPYCSSPLSGKTVPIAPSQSDAPVPSIPSPDSKMVNLSLPRAQVEQILGDMMSGISERTYSAGWITGTETVLPLLAKQAIENNAPALWGSDIITVEEARTLLAFAEALGYWVTWHDEEGMMYKPYHP